MLFLGPPPAKRGSTENKAVLALNLAIAGDKAFAKATGGTMESKFFLNRQAKNALPPKKCHLLSAHHLVAWLSEIFSLVLDSQVEPFKSSYF